MYLTISIFSLFLFTAVFILHFSSIPTSICSVKKLQTTRTNIISLFIYEKEKAICSSLKTKYNISCLHIGSEKSLHILKTQSYRNMVVAFFFGIKSHVTNIAFSIYMINNKGNKRSNFLLSLIWCLFL